MKSDGEGRLGGLGNWAKYALDVPNRCVCGLCESPESDVPARDAVDPLAGASGSDMGFASGMGRPIAWLTAAVLVGLAFRCFHYFRNPSVWHDEAALIVNVLGKGYRECFGPLFFSEAAPPLFLWLEKVVVDILGDETWSLRLIPFLASCVSLCLFAWVAAKLLPLKVAPWATLLFACSDHLLWHACEAKPYALDVLIAVMLLAQFLLTTPTNLARVLWLNAIAAPLVLFLSFPACFLYGGYLLAMFPLALSENQRQAKVAYAGLVASIAVGFALLYLGPVTAQRDPTIVECWKGSFPDWDRPLTIPGWTVLSTLEVFRYCCEPLGGALALLALAGAWQLGRTGKWQLLVLCLVPLALPYLASCLRAYPFGGSRVLVYNAPMLFILIGVGIPSLHLWARANARPLAWIGALLLLSPLAWSSVTVARPWMRADCHAAAKFVLENRLPSDTIASNHWEYLYYFRNAGPGHVSLVGRAHFTSDRMWILITDAAPEARLLIARTHLPANGEVLAKCEFVRTTVYLVGRKDSLDSVSSAAAPPAER